VFPGTAGRMISDMTMSKYVQGHEATVHGFRSSFRDWTAEQCPTVPDAVAEEALAHKIGNETTRAYRRTKLDAMRRDLLEAWGRYVDGEAVPLLRLVG
jgi:integrase